jgi:hypothetical protein
MVHGTWYAHQGQCPKVTQRAGSLISYKVKKVKVLCNASMAAHLWFCACKRLLQR